VTWIYNQDFDRQTEAGDLGDLQIIRGSELILAILLRTEES